MLIECGGSPEGMFVFGVEAVCFVYGVLGHVCILEICVCVCVGSCVGESVSKWVSG